MKPLTDYCSHTALFFDLQGHFVGKCKIDWKKPTFIFKNRVYNFLPDKTSFFKLRTLFKSTKYYMYNIDNSMPILLNGENKGIIDPIAYRRILETDLIKKLNDLANQGILAFILQPKVLIILAVLFGLVWFFASGQSPQEAVNYVSGRG